MVAKANTLAAPGQSGASASLRDRKKAQQHKALIDIAVTLFTRRGYDNVRIEDIASEAGISAKTVYNYFPTKRDLLVAYMLAERIRTMEIGIQQVLDSVSGDLHGDLARLIHADIGEGFGGGDKDLWLEIVAVNVRDSADERFRSIRWMLTGYIERLLCIYRDNAIIAPDVDLRLAAHVIHLVYTDAFVEFCADPGRSADDAVDQVMATVRAVFAQSLFRRSAEDRPLA